MRKKSKHQKEGSKLNKVLFMLLLIIIVMMGIFLYGKFKKTQDSLHKVLDNSLSISYMNKDNIRIYIKDNDVIPKNLIETTEGTIEISMDNGKTFKDYSNIELQDGTYIARIKTDDGVSKETTFVVDTILPKGVVITSTKEESKLKTKGKYTVGDTMVLSDVNGINNVKLMFLDEDSTIEILREGEVKTEIKYAFEKSGKYGITVTDTAGNDLFVSRFTVENKEE